MGLLSGRLARLVTAFVMVVAVSAGPGATALDAQEQAYTTTFVQLGPSEPGVLYQPKTAGPKQGVAMVVMHPFSSYLSHIACGQLASRGYTVLCADPHTVNRASNTYTLEEGAPDVGRAVRYLRGRPEIKSVVLVGHSAAGQMMGFYQAVAEQGPSICQGPEKIVKCPNSLAGLPPADGMILLDSHGGNGFTTLTYVDPSVADEDDPSARNPELDMYDPANGFSTGPEGAVYSPAFRQRFLAAQSARSNRLIGLALQRRDALDAGQGMYPDDEPMTINGARARIWQPALHLQARTHDPHPILHPDGSITREIVHSVRPPSGGADEARSYNPSALQTSVRTFLSSNAVWTTADYDIGEDYITGVDWASSSSSTPWSVEHVGVPLLITPMTGHYFMVTDEIIYNHAASPDKTIAYVEGAVHGLTTCRACEQFPGQYVDTAKTLFDYVDGWLAARYAQ